MTALPLSNAAADTGRWRAHTLRGAFRFLFLVQAAGLPFYPRQSLPEGLTRLLVFGAGALSAADPRRRRLWGHALALLLLEIAGRSVFERGLSPGPTTALAACVLLALVFLGFRAAAAYLAAVVGLVVACSEAVRSGLIPALEPYSFASLEVWARSLLNVVLLSLAMGWTVARLLQRFETGLRDRGETIARLRLEERERAALQARRDAETAALARAQGYEVLGRMSAGIAHDFNNMLVVILSWADLLREPGVSDAEREEATGAILAATGRAGDLVRQLASLGRPEEGGQEELDLATLATELGRSLTRLLPEGIAVERGELASAQVRGVSARLQQVLLNFALNARDAMPAGGTLTLGSGPANAAEAAGLAGSCVAVRVRDTGAGISPEVQGKLFQPFFSTKPEGAGLGLGLVSSLAIARDHGGRIHVESAPGQGSTFSLVLPAALPQAAAAQPAPPAALAQGKRVLLVEDEAPLRKLMARALRRGGLEVEEAADGAAALALLATHPRPDLLLVDAVLPDLPSQRLIDAARAAQPPAAVLVCSGHLDAATLRGRAGPGPYAELPKPFGGEALLRKVAEVLAAAR